MLRDVRQGATLFILDKKNRSIGRAEVMQQPVLSPPQFQYTQSGMIPQRQTMAVRIRYEGKEFVLDRIYADQSSAESVDGNSIVICENNEALVSELKAFKMSNDNIVANIDTYKDNSAWCEEQLVKLDPVKQAEIQSSKQVEAIREEFNGIVSQQNKKLEDVMSVVNGISEMLKSYIPNNDNGGKGK